MSGPFPGGPRYDAEWADVLDAEFWAIVRRMSEFMRHAQDIAAYFPPREATP